MLKYFYTIVISALLLGLAGCRKYVEVDPVNVRILNKTADYQALLYYSTLMETAYTNPIFASDDAESDDIRWQNSLSTSVANTYSWASKIYSEVEEDADWQKLHQQLYVCNTVIEGVLTSVDGTDEQKKAVWSAALVHRAFIFYTLVNIYAKQYDASTAATDPGIPLVLGTKFFTDLSRASIAKVYEQIESDLNNALPALNNTPDYSTNPSKAAVYAMLARVNLNKRNFPEAKRNAELALSLKGTLLNLNPIAAAPTTHPNRILNPEIIFFKRISSFPVALPLSASLENLFNRSDIRYTLFTAPASVFYMATFTNRSYAKHRVTDAINTGPSVPEMMLIKAECEARSNNVDGAMVAVNTLRQTRFKPVDYVPFAASSSADALRIVIEERRREMMGTGMRWFDQRRLAKEAGLISTVTRVFKGSTLTLEPNGNRYTFPIGDKYIQYNPEITQNPR